MKQIAQSLHLHLPPIKVYSDDLAYIYAEMKGAEPSQMSLKVGSYVLDSAEEIADVPLEMVRYTEVDAFYTRGEHRIRLTVDLDTWDAAIHLSDRSRNDLLGLSQKIERRLRRGRRFWYPLVAGFPVSFLSSALVAGVFAGPSLWVLYTQFPELVRGVPGSVLGGTIGFGSSYAVGRVLRHRHSTIYVKLKRHEHKHYFSRNKDDLITNALILAAGVVIGVVTPKCEGTPAQVVPSNASASGPVP
jgi:hypothetical protein